MKTELQNPNVVGIIQTNDRGHPSVRELMYSPESGTRLRQEY